MSAMVTAVVGSAVVGAYSSHAASKAQSKSAEANRAMAQDQYSRQAALDAERLEDWEALYGNTEENLAKSIEAINGRSYEVSGHTELEKQYSSASRRLTENLAARNISGGAQVSGQTELLSDLARGKATVSANADTKAMEDKANMFMNLGLKQKPYTNIGDTSAIQLANTQMGNAEAQGALGMGSNISSAIGAGMQLYGGPQPAQSGGLGDFGTVNGVGVNKAAFDAASTGYGGTKTLVNGTPTLVF